jgi:hypothetical protein
MSNKKEVAVIDFTKFDIQQLPELHGKKEEIKKVIKENPVVKVTDNASYELAKKSRTAVKTLRTSLEKEKKEVNDRIKKSVLEVVANEYDSLITSVRNDENARQEEVTAWEEIKENERLEKLRAEELRVFMIKDKISEFRQFWEGQIPYVTFDVVEEMKSEFEKRVVDFDRASLAEFEVLFDDAVAHLDNLLNARIATLTEQENIRLEQIRLAEEREKQEAESKRIAEEMRIEREKYLAEQKRIAEEQRIAQENFLKEKREFEEKQAEAKFQERSKRLFDADCIYVAEQDGFAKQGYFIHQDDVRNASDELFERELQDAKNPIVESNESAKESVVVFKIDGDNLTAHEEYHEADVDPRGVKTETPIGFGALTEETWQDIWTNWHTDFHGMTFLDYLKENYNVPTRKQQ